MTLEKALAAALLAGVAVAPNVANAWDTSYADSELKKSRDSGEPYKVVPWQPAILVDQDGKATVRVTNGDVMGASRDFEFWGEELAEKLDELNCTGPIFGDEKDGESHRVNELNVTDQGGDGRFREGFPDLVVEQGESGTSIFFPDTASLVGTIAWYKHWTGAFSSADSCEDLARPSRITRNGTLKSYGNGTGGVALNGAEEGTDFVYVQPVGAPFWMAGTGSHSFERYVQSHFGTFGVTDTDYLFSFERDLSDEPVNGVVRDGTEDTFGDTRNPADYATPEEEDEPEVELGTSSLAQEARDPTDEEIFGSRGSDIEGWGAALGEVEEADDEEPERAAPAPEGARREEAVTVHDDGRSTSTRRRLVADPNLPDLNGWKLYDLDLRDTTVGHLPLADLICEGTQGLMTPGSNGRWRASVQTIANEGSSRSPAYAALGRVVGEGTHPVCDSWSDQQEIIALNRGAFGFGNKGTADANGNLAEKLNEMRKIYLPEDMIPGDGGTLLNVEEINENMPADSLFNLETNSDGVAYLVPSALQRKRSLELVVDNTTSDSGNDDYHNYIRSEGAKIQAAFEATTENSYTNWARGNLSTNDQEIGREAQALVAAQFYLENAASMSHGDIVRALEEKMDYGVSSSTVRRRIKDGLNELLELEGPSKVRTMHEASEVASLYKMDQEEQEAPSETSQAAA